MTGIDVAAAGTAREADPMVDLVHVPADPDHPDAWTVEGTVQRRRRRRRRYPRLDRLLARRPHHARDTARAAPQGAPARRGPRGSHRADAAVGRAMIGLPQVGNTHLAVIYVAVHPDWRRRGIGAALWDAGLDIARTAGRRVVISDSSHRTEPPPGPDALESPTGSGPDPRGRRRHPLRAGPRLHARAGGPALGARRARRRGPPAARPRHRLPRPSDAGRVRRASGSTGWPSSRRG